MSRGIFLARFLGDVKAKNPLLSVRICHFFSRNRTLPVKPFRLPNFKNDDDYVTYACEQFVDVGGGLGRSLKEQQSCLIGICLCLLSTINRISKDMYVFSIDPTLSALIKQSFYTLCDNSRAWSSILPTSVSTTRLALKSLLFPASAITMFGSAWRWSSLTHDFALSSEDYQ
jgi:hypothetical protein